MDRKFFTGILALLLFTGCTACESLEVKEEKYGKALPVIEQSFASKAMRKGDTWRIYLRASDPDGDMKTILAYFKKGGGGGPTAVSHTQIKENDRREINGYLYWHPGPEVENFSEMAMTIQIEDMAGHFSKSVSLPLRIQPSGSQELPPEGAFQEKELGPIMITLKPVSASTVP